MTEPTAPALPADGVLVLGEARFDFGTLRFADGGRLSPKAAQVLWLLAQNPHRTLEKDWLLDQAWPGQVRVPDVLVQAIGEIRRGLGAEARDGLILTVPKLGYRLQVEPQWLGLAGPVSSPSAAARPAPPPPQSIRFIAVIAVLAVLAAGGWLLSLPADEPMGEPTPATHPSGPNWQVRDVRRITAEPGADLMPRLSPDGSRVAYVRRHENGRYKIHLRGLDGEPARVLAPMIDADDLQPSWDRQGTRLAWQRFEAGECHYIVHRLDSDEQGPMGSCFGDLSTPLEWSADGESLIITDRLQSQQRTLHLVRLDLESGQMRLLDYARDDDRTDYDPQLSPDGQRLAFLRSGGPLSEVLLHDADRGQTRSLATLAGGVDGYAWLPDGNGLLLSGRFEAGPELVTLDLDGQRDVLSAPAWRRLHRAAQRPLYVAQDSENRGSLWRQDVDGGLSRAADDARGRDRYPTPLADGSLLFVSDRSGRSELWQRAADGATRRLTELGAGAMAAPQVLADGRVLFCALSEGHWQLWQRHADGALRAIGDPRYQFYEVVAAAGGYWAIGALDAQPGQRELLRLQPGAPSWGVEPTGIRAIRVRGDAEHLTIRQHLQRGIVAVDPETLALGARLGDRHFFDWRHEAGGVLHWQAVDALRSELRWIGYDGAGRSVLPPGIDYDNSGGLARDDDGRLLFARSDIEQTDLVVFALEREPSR